MLRYSNKQAAVVDEAPEERRRAIKQEELRSFTAPWPDRRKGPALCAGPAVAGCALAPAGPERGAEEG